MHPPVEGKWECMANYVERHIRKYYTVWQSEVWNEKCCGKLERAKPVCVCVSVCVWHARKYGNPEYIAVQSVWGDMARQHCIPRVK